MPNLPWDTIVPVLLNWVFWSILIGLLVGLRIWAVNKPPKVRPAVAAAQRGLHQRDHRNDAE
jgi:hypothetical protein